MYDLIMLLYELECVTVPLFACMCECVHVCNFILIRVVVLLEGVIINQMLSLFHEFPFE